MRILECVYLKRISKTRLHVFSEKASSTMYSSFYGFLVLVSCIITLQIQGNTMIREMTNSDGKTENLLENGNSALIGRYKTPHQKRDVSEKRCESGWNSYGEMCYKVEGMKEKDRLPFDDAEEFCVEEGGHLASIDSKELNEFLATLVPNGHRPKAWIGLYKEQNELQFNWTDQTTLGYKNWGSGQPSKKYDAIQENCVEFYTDGLYGKWNDVNCEMHRAFICQRSKGEKSNKTTNIHGKKKSQDITEKYHENGWYTSGKMYYKANGMNEKEWLPWNKAEEFCVQEGGHLVSIHSAHLNKFLANLVQNSVQGDAWIGLHDTKSEGTFEWTDHTSVKFVNWAYSEPNGRFRYSEDDCVEIYYHYHEGEKRKWNDAHCDTRKPFICQKAKDDTDPDTNASIIGIIGGAIGSILILVTLVAAFAFRSWKRKGRDPEYLNLQPKTFIPQKPGSGNEYLLTGSDKPGYEK